LLPASDSGALPAISAASARPAAASSPSSTVSFTSPQSSAWPAATVRPTKNSSRVRAAPIDVDELAQARVRVDEAQLGRRHAELRRAGRDAQVAGDRELQAAADRVAVERRTAGYGCPPAPRSPRWNGCATRRSASCANSPARRLPMS
jgi:hypothetical protein